MREESLFSQDVPQPLASRMRPETLDEFAGQQHLIGKGKVLYNLIEKDCISSMIFWGPPGVGKTTLARIIAHHTKSVFIDFSAVTSGIREIRKVMEEAEKNRMYGQRTIVFVDEIHRFNKAQQDAFLPFVEKGSIILIGATTENPSFEINSALLSRCKVFVLKSLTTDDLVQLLRRAVRSPRGLGKESVSISDDVLTRIAVFANGDARMALSTLEMVVLNGEQQGGRYAGSEFVILLEQCTSQKSLLYDKNGEEHYNIISALHKSMRNSDPDAAVYWLARMLEAGEDPLYVARRVTRFASEDIGHFRPAGADYCRRCISGLSLYRHAGMYGSSDGSRRVHVTGSQIQCAVYGLWPGPSRCTADVIRTGAAGDTERGNKAHERPGVWEGISVCP